MVVVYYATTYAQSEMRARKGSESGVIQAILCGTYGRCCL